MKLLTNCLKVIFVDFRYFIALGIRLFMIILSEILYKEYDIVYTDIDYHVFSDGAKHMMNLESPYNRETYRYTPLLAFMMIPNHIINYNYGKILFSIVDVLVGLLIEILLNLQKSKKDKILKEVENIKDPNNIIKAVNEINDNDIDNNINIINTPKNKNNENLLTYLYSFVDNPYAYIALLYLYNPLTINICTRGSADCLITFLVLLTLIFIEIGFFPIAGLIFGFAIHFKIYPIIYAPALYLYLISKNVSISKILNENSDNENILNNQIKILLPASNFYLISYYYNYFKILMRKVLIKLGQIIKILFMSIFNFKAITFAFLTIFTFVTFLVLFYILYGNKFLYEYFLYHLVRKDHRHNYSIFYYLIYLTYTSSFSKMLTLITFLPQVLLILLSTILLFQNINLCLLILTMIFVTFNKVVTAQYFLWYICLIPLIAPNNKLFDFQKHTGKFLYGIFLFLIWLFFELIWNSFSHQLEYKGENLFLKIWGINGIFFFINCVIIKEILGNQIKN